MNLLSQKSSDRERLRQQEAIVKRQEKGKKEEEVLSDDEYDKYIGRMMWMCIDNNCKLKKTEVNFFLQLNYYPACDFKDSLCR